MKFFDAAIQSFKEHSIWYACLSLAASTLDVIKGPIQTAGLFIGVLVALVTLAIKSHEMIKIYYTTYRNYSRKVKRAKSMAKHKKVDPKGIS